MRKQFVMFAAFLAVGAIGLGPSAATTEAAPRGLGLGVHGGYGESKDADNGSGLVGAHVEFRPGAILGFRGAIDYKLKEDVTLQFPDDEELGYTVASVPVTALARIYFPLGSILPYATAGAQWRYITYDYDQIPDAISNFKPEESETAFGWLFGGGVELSSSESFSLFGEIRYEIIDADRDLNQDVVDAVEEFEYDQWHVVGGITFFLN